MKYIILVFSLLLSWTTTANAMIDSSRALPKKPAIEQMIERINRMIEQQREKQQWAIAPEPEKPAEKLPEEPRPVRQVEVPVNPERFVKIPAGDFKLKRTKSNETTTD